MDLSMKIDLSTMLHKPGERAGKDRPQVERMAEEFESFLIFSVLKELEKPTYSAKKSCAEETQMSLFYEKVGEVLAKKGIGIKEMIARYAERGSKVFQGTDEKS